MLSIRNPEVERIARQLARARGVSMTETILDALHHQRAVVARQLEHRMAAILAIAARCTGAPDMDTRGPDEILGYDESGAFGNGSR